MSFCHVPQSGNARRRLLMLGASAATLACVLGAMPVAAQSLGGLLGQQARAPRPQAQAPTAVPQRSPTMQAALARQRSTQTRIQQIRAYAAAAREAVSRGGVTDGLSGDGLDPTDAIREAIAAVRAGDDKRANELLISAGAANDATGLTTWQGAGLPGQSVIDGRVVVTIDQTQQRALLSWNRFDIGANTTLQFNQKVNGVGQADWVAVNRVTNATDPSLILGNLKADGTVVVLNRAGIIFGKNSQVNTHSLLASTLELGNAARFVSGNTGNLRATTIKERNNAFLETGLFGPGNGTVYGGTPENPAGSSVLVSAQAKDQVFSGAFSVRFVDQIEGDVIVDSGAQISSGAGGFVMLTAPRIESRGHLSAIDGQVSLQAGRAITFLPSTGASSELDPNVRGFKLNSFDYGLSTNPDSTYVPSAADGSIHAGGLIESKRGYLSLGTGAFGDVTLDGYLEASTSVSRNGKISLLSGNITLAGSADPARASGIAIVTDDSGETIPQGTAAEPANFKSSQIEIGTQVQNNQMPFGGLVPTDFTMGRNAVIYAPNADVRIGATTLADNAASGYFDVFPGSIDIGSGAIIDVSGLKDVLLDASRNQLAITPVKRNELRDSPNYREVALDGNFTLNGATLYIDPRLSGVREDGVAWVGSPLIEAGSLAGQIGSTAGEFMTKGGSVSLQTATLLDFNSLNPTNAPTVRIARDATIDFSGGWVRYAAGPVRTSRLITDDGRIVDIGKANQNDKYVGVVDGFTEVQPRFGIFRTFLNAAGQSLRLDPAYDEGRDAGSLKITAAAAAIDGDLHGNAFAGSRQIADGRRPSLKSPQSGDGRLLQRNRYEMPSGGGLFIETLGDTIVYHGKRGAAESDRAELLLDDGMLTKAGLSALTLRAAGSITFAGAHTETLQSADALSLTGASHLELAPGGALLVEAGRSIRFDGTVVAASGRIEARTQLIGMLPAGLDSRFSNGSAFRTGLYGNGNGDDISANYLYAANPGDLNPFDVTVTGTLSTAGLWVNDFSNAGILRGGAFGNGGSISLTVAPSVFAAIGTSLSTATEAVDLSGSIRVSGELNVSSGGYVNSKGGLDLSGRGGNVSLINATTYASTRLTNTGQLTGNGSQSLSDLPFNGDNQSVDFTPQPGRDNILALLPALVPTPSSSIDIASASIKGFGFAGGGTFTLVAPSISFGSDNRAGATHIGLDFFRTTGFGTLDLTSYRSRIVDDLFTNERSGKSAFLETTQFKIGAGETLDLTQWLLPSILEIGQAAALRRLETGADLLAQPLLAPIKPAQLWDQRGAKLVLGGLTELDVLAGGRIVGAPEASITAGKIYNAGEIVLHGGSIVQRNALPDSMVVAGLGVRDAELGGHGLADAFGGSVDAQGRFDEGAANAAGITDPQGGGRLLTNRELVTRDGADRLIYFLGLVDQSQGVVLAPGSVTDLSGIALYDPRAPILGGSSRIRSGRIVDGGSLLLSAGFAASRLAVQGVTVTVARESTLIRDDAARLDISGVNAVFDQAAGLGFYTPYLEWSAAGTISALGGGSLGNSAIQARGGVEAAQGGTLEWLRPTLGSGDGGELDYLSSDLVAKSGFDSLIARGSLELDGDFSLVLRKALLVTSRDPLASGTPLGADASVAVTATAGTKASVGASYIRFASRISSVSFDRAASGDAEVDFVAGRQGIDFAGGIGFDGSIAALTFRTSGDARFIGVNDQGVAAGQVVYNGALISGGDLTIDARRSYATTGTGNLQGLLEGLPAAQAQPFSIAVLGDHSITFGNTFLDPDAPAPFSAGSHLRVLGPRIIQNGYLAAPLGLLELGSTTAQTVGSFQIAPTRSIVFGAGSVTTVSGAGLNIPYGTTTDLIEYYFPSLRTPITKLPTGQLQLAADSIVQEEGARFDGRGGGDVYAYEFQPGVGGSRDVLDRFNRDPFSSNAFDPATGIGYQYSDKRQVFALVPIAQVGSIAPYDPTYSDDYGSAGPVDLYGAHAGKTVILDAAPGVAAGEYLLVPAKYAMSIPGALRIVENVDAGAPVPGQSSSLLDGSIVVGGRFAYADTGISESTRRSFTVQSKDVFLKYSTIKATSGSETIAEGAAKNGFARPRLPLDAARVILAPLSELRIAGVFDTRAAEGGQGGQFDIVGNNIVIAAEGSEAEQGALTLYDSSLAKLNAPSLLIGGRRSDGADGTTVLSVTAHEITMRGGARLAAPELLLAVGGDGSMLSVADGATLTASGTLGTQPQGDYTLSTGGSLLRLANGAERLVKRTGAGATTINIGAAMIAGENLALDSSGSFVVADDAAIAARQIAISGQSIHFDNRAGADGEAGVIGSRLAAKLATAERLTVRSPGAIRFAAGTYRFNGLVLDTATVAAGADAVSGEAVTIDAGNIRLTNSTAASDGCVVAGFCGQAGTLALNASTISFGNGNVRSSGFADAVVLAARDGMYVEGKGSFSSGSTALTLRTPFLADRSPVADPRDQKVRPDFSFLTTGDFLLTAQGTNAAARPAGNGAPGARIGIGAEDARVRSARIEGGLIRATAGIIDIQSDTDITLAGASLETPGYEATFGDKDDPVTVSAGGGTINLMSARGNITTDAASRLVIDNGVGEAGALNLFASKGAITLAAAISPDAKGQRSGSLAFDAGAGAFDLSGFVTRYGKLFGGDVAIRSGVGDLDLAAGQTLKARNISLTADGGAITIAGKVDTSGVDVTGMSADAARNALVNGGDIDLWGRNGVTLASTAVLDTHTTGYADGDSRPASAGNVTIGIENENAAINIANGAIIDVGARRTQAALAAGENGGRLIPEVITDPTTGTLVTVYRYAEPDVGGTVRLRAPVIGADRNKVAVGLHGSIQGADSVQLEGFQRYDLDAIADAGLYTGISRDADGTIHLDFAKGGLNPFTGNFDLADGSASLVRFIQDFDVSTVDGSSLEGVRLRPGVELASIGAIKTDSQWNLAAATFSPEQLQAAVDAGVLQIIPELGTGGQAQYRVVPGREGDLLDRYASFLYRTDGTARGEAPVVTLRAGGDLTIDRSISDGFFTFRDKSDPAYINHQLGGGDRDYSPALGFSCGGSTGSCSSIVSYADGIVRNPGTGGTLVISLGSAAVRGDVTSDNADYVNSPLALIGNGAAGNVDAAGNPIGDSLGFGELFPLLDGNVAMHSSDLRLVAGAGSVLSANPFQVDRSLAADVTVSGQYSYRVTATGTVNYRGPLQFSLLRGNGVPSVNFQIGDTLGLTDPTAGLNGLRDDAYTQLNWGSTSGLGADARSLAQQYFAGKGYRFVGSANAPTGIIAPLSEVIGFLQTFEPSYQAGLASGRTGYTANRTPPLISYGNAGQQNSPTTPNLAYVRSYVRTGDGSIGIAAARDIDLRGSQDPIYRREDGTQASGPDYSVGRNRAAQFSASAIYTAGVRVAPGDIFGKVIGGGPTLSITPNSPYLVPGAENVNFIPSPKALSDMAPVLAHDGGDVLLDAGRDVLARRDVWSDLFLSSGAAYTSPAGNGTSSPGAGLGSPTQIWRPGSIGADTEIGLAARYFSSGVGALAGGDVTVRAGRDVTDLTVALDSGVTTTMVGNSKVMLTFGTGDLSVSAGRDILAGRFDIASGSAVVRADRDVAAFGVEAAQSATPQYLRIRLSDAVVDVSAGGRATLASVSALGVLSGNPATDTNVNAAAAGFFSPIASFALQANEAATITETESGFAAAYGRQGAFQNPNATNPEPGEFLQVLPPSFGMTSLSASISLPSNYRQMLYPSPIGQLRLFSDGDISGLVLAMSDVDPGKLGGAFGVSRELTPYRYPVVTPNTSDAELRYQHNQNPTHLNDAEPIRIHTNGDFEGGALFLPKQARVTAAGDIVDLFFQGQNLLGSDITRIRAGGDIRGTIGAQRLPAVLSNNFILGGPGTLIVEAGGDLGPFVSSANVKAALVGDNNIYSFAGGIRTVGNDLNPWLDHEGADIRVGFGVSGGSDYAALRETYLNPDRLAALDGDLFEQVADVFGNTRPDRDKPVYAPILAKWLRDNAPDKFAAIFTGSFPDTDAGNAALAQAAYGRMADLYAAFAAIDPLHQQDFLTNDLLFNEIGAAGDANGPSYQQYVRGYRALQTLYPTSLGYTDNLAPYTIDPSTISPDHPLGEPVRNIVDGQPQVATRVQTGNLDLRLATIQTARGGDVAILGPGGDLIAGSVIRTADQPLRRQTTFQVPGPDNLPNLASGNLTPRFSNIVSIPLGYEGILTLEGGQIRTITDGDVLLNQSRVFSQQNGDIVMWSSNGDIAAGQGPKSSSTFPPITVRLDEDGFGEVNSAGSVSGAGIGSFKRTPDDPPSDVVLIAPVGEVDAGDAGVRASGNVIVAAARVANADNFKAEGDITGVPTAGIAQVSVAPTDPTSSIRDLVKAVARNPDQRDPRSIITVQVLGPSGDGQCPRSGDSNDPDCGPAGRDGGNNDVGTNPGGGKEDRSRQDD